MEVLVEPAASVEVSADSAVHKFLENKDLFGDESDNESLPDQQPVSRPSEQPAEERSSKRKKEPKPKKLKKAEIQTIHSDSQRLVRESSLNLPHYEPRAKDISSFLSRVRARQPDNKENTATPPVNDSPSDRGDTPPPSHVTSNNAEVEDKQDADKTEKSAVASKAPPRSRQTTLTSLFSARPPSPQPVKPHLSSADDFLLDRELAIEVEPPRQLTALEQFQHRFSQHTSSSSKPRLEAQGEGGLVSQEVVASLPARPGAIRLAVREQLAKQLALRRAEERAVAEEVRRLYSEDQQDEAEDEEEMTDADTTDEEDEAIDTMSNVTRLSHDQESTNEIADNQQPVDSDDEELNFGVKTKSAPKIIDSDDEDTPPVAKQLSPPPLVTRQPSPPPLVARQPSPSANSMPPLQLTVETDSSHSTEEGAQSEEGSFLWPAVSLPPAQPHKDFTFDPQTQCEEAQAAPDVSVDEATQFLDEDGFLCIRTKEKTRVSAIAQSLDASQETTPTQLLELCSGRFDSQVTGHVTGHVSRESSNSSQGVRELLGLTNPPTGISGLNNNTARNDFSQLNEVIGLCSGVFPTTQPANQTPAGAGYHGDSESEDDEMPRIIKRKKVKQPTTKYLAEFVESEAELSGSDVGSDDEDEAALLEEEEAGLWDNEQGHDSDLPLSDSELWDQVNRVHRKQTLADDKADLRTFKERFLKEGDLFEDGLALKNGFFRTRHFARSDADSVDLFSEAGGDSELVGGDSEEFNSQAEATRRKERLEREEFINKCREKDQGSLAIDEDSQSILSIITDSQSSVARQPTPSLATGFKGNRGSFLKHDSKTLQRLSSLTTPKTGGQGFVFKKQAPAGKGSKRSVSEDAGNNSKRVKLDRSVSLPSQREESIFSVLH